ncbi:MAG: hypothetical protein ACTSU7_12700 [Candidatus Heimdallarchaeaceae archaeon]
MPRTCKVCGSGNISLIWSPRWGSTGYCSFRCNAIGKANYTFAFAVFLGIVAIGLIIIALVIPNPKPEALIYGIIAGAMAVLCSIQSSIGFFLKRQDGY